MFLIIAALTLLGVITFQNFKYPQLRSLTISDGLYQEVPTFWLLDLAYVGLSTALVAAAAPTHSWLLATIAAVAFLVTAVSNTFSVQVDKLTGGKHNQIHTDATIVMFVTMLAFQAANNGADGILWALSALGVLGPVVAFIETKRLNLPAGPIAEKLAVFFLCAWLIAWSIFK